MDSPGHVLVTPKTSFIKKKKHFVLTLNKRTVFCDLMLGSVTLIPRLKYSRKV